MQDFVKIKADLIRVLKLYEKAVKHTDRGICYFVSQRSNSLSLSCASIIHDAYLNLGIDSLDYSTKESKSGNLIDGGRNWLRIEVVKLMIEALKDESVTIIEYDNARGSFGYDFVSNEQQGQEKIKKLKDFIKLHQS